MLRGVFTAIITPFRDDESVDEEALKKLIDFNIENGVSGIVPCGTTGESPTLTEEEQKRLIKLTVEHVNKRVIVVAGTGSNNTKHAVEMTKYAEDVGADYALVVNPYYNKPTQEGLYRHFKAIANSVKIPIVIYNIKGRTGVNVETDTLIRLTNDCKNITAVKEASGDLNQMKDVIAKRREGFSVLSGDDGITLDLIKAGGDGVISVASNLVPDKMSKLVKVSLDGKFVEAEILNNELKELFDIEFIETNPIPIKYMLSFKNMCKEVYRLPMCELSLENKEKVKSAVKNLI